jgi:single-strand DNA-binding protein
VAGADELLQRRVLAGDGRERQQEGEKRSIVVVVADEIGPSLRWATARLQKNDRRGPAESVDVRAGVGGREVPNEPGYEYGEEPF